MQPRHKSYLILIAGILSALSLAYVQLGAIIPNHIPEAQAVNSIIDVIIKLLNSLNALLISNKILVPLEDSDELEQPNND